MSRYIVVRDTAGPQVVGTSPLAKLGRKQQLAETLNNAYMIAKPTRYRQPINSVQCSIQRLHKKKIRPHYAGGGGMYVVVVAGVRWWWCSWYAMSALTVNCLYYSRQSYRTHTKNLESCSGLNFLFQHVDLLH